MRGRKRRAVIEGCPSSSPSSFSPYTALLPASSPGPGRGHLPSLMKIHGLIFIFGVVSETVAHKTMPVPPLPPYQKPGEADRMTWLSALAEQGQLQGLKMGFFGGGGEWRLKWGTMLLEMRSACLLESTSGSDWSQWGPWASSEEVYSRRGGDRVGDTYASYLKLTAQCTNRM